MKILAIDYGKKRIGLAVGEGALIFPAGVIENKGRDLVLQEIKIKCEEEGVDKIVVGRPVSLSGETGPQAEKVDEFIKMMDERLPLPVDIEDERLSSKMADQLMKEAQGQGASRDEVAAMVILESYINRK